MIQINDFRPPSVSACTPDKTMINREESHVDTGARICFHCGEPVPRNGSLTVEIDGRTRPMCCPGCLAAAQAICDYGLEKFYRYRTGASPRPEADAGQGGAVGLQLYDDPSIQEEFVESEADGSHSASLVIENIACPACCWLIESQLARLEGMLDASINYASHHARIHWDGSRLPLSRILQKITALGYRAWPYRPVL